MNFRLKTSPHDVHRPTGLMRPMVWEVGDQMGVGYGVRWLRRDELSVENTAVHYSLPYWAKEGCVVGGGC
jgi:hypothetical protein